MRLIDADALDDKLYDAMRKYEAYDSCETKTIGGIMEAQDLLDDAPTVDAVEVVRCKDCEYKRELEGHLVCGDSMRAGMGVDVFEIPTYYFGKIAPDDFCSRGRRKDNG